MKIQEWFVQLLLPVSLMLLVSVSPVYSAAVDMNGPLSQMEQQLFFSTYNSDTPGARLDRIETEIYGTVHHDQPESARLDSLKQFFLPPPQPPVTAAKQGQQPLPQSGSMGPQPKPQASSALPDESQYPAVSAMEQKVLHQSFEHEALENRLARLEQRVLGRAQNGTLQERTDQLKMVVLGDTGNNRGDSAYQPEDSDPSGNSNNAPITYNNSQSSPSGSASAAVSADMQRALPAIEKKVLRQTFPQDSVESRLNRIETRLFNSTASDMSPEDRLYRIASVMTAKNSSQQEQQVYRGAGPSYGVGGGGGSYSKVPGSVGIWGSMLLMILMSLI